MKEKFILIRDKHDAAEEVMLDSSDLLHEMYKAIGCDLIETVPASDGWAEVIDGTGHGQILVIVDEEGAFKDNHYNHLASAVAGVQICGNALIADTVVRDGEDDIGGLGEECCTRLLNAFKTLVGR